MANELGIDRSDIERWTKEAVRKEVQKLTGRLDIEKIAANSVRDAIHGGTYSYGMSNDLKKIVRDQVATAIAGKVQFLP